MGIRHGESCSNPDNQNGGMIFPAPISPLFQEDPSHLNASHTTYSRSNDNDSVAIPPHPLRIKPAGNVYGANENIKLSAGYFAILPDELIIQILESLDAVALTQLQRTCKALYAFTRLEDLWKTLYIE